MKKTLLSLLVGVGTLAATEAFAQGPGFVDQYGREFRAPRVRAGSRATMGRVCGAEQAPPVLVPAPGWPSAGTSLRVRAGPKAPAGQKIDRQPQRIRPTCFSRKAGQTVARKESCVPPRQ